MREFTANINDQSTDRRNAVSMRTLSWRIANRVARALETPAAPRRPPALSSSDERRFVPELVVNQGRCIEAARAYAAPEQEARQAWFFAKPYDPAPGNPAFYYEHYQVLNLLQAMRIPHRGRVLEPGCGPGWVTEMLVLLGFDVVGLDPAEGMLEVARERVAGGIAHRRTSEPGSATFHARTIEECGLPSDHFDAVFFHEALHHVLDERRALAEVFRVLKPGGVLGVSEWAWSPGAVDLEAKLRAEMDEFGTLESPFTQAYLDHLLHVTGFVEIQHYHAINGLFPEEDGRQTLESLTDAHALSTNNLTARKAVAGS